MVKQNVSQGKAERICVIVPAYEAAHYLEQSLPPLIALRDGGHVDDVIVVDDCSPSPATAEMAEQFGATVIRAAKNGGPGAARNLAATKTDCELLWFVDADVVVHPASVERIPVAFADPAVHAMFGSYDENPPAPGFASQYKNLMHRYYHTNSSRQATTFWSGCGVIRRDAFLRLDGFDVEQFTKPSIEDIELGYRIREAGGEIVLDPELLCTHLKEWSLREVVMTDVLKRAVPWSRLIATREMPENNLNVSTPERIRAGIAGLWALSILAAMTAFLWPHGAMIFMAMTIIMVCANWRLLMFFTRRKGLPFGLAALAFHQVYYIYSAVTFSLVHLRHRPISHREASAS
ncbi:MAG: glycosyltransferase [Hyphomonadaceae bacterium]|nr:glycosyltransferase [Hyphomonadaceae bacterium]